MPIALPQSRAELDRASVAVARIRSAVTVTDVEAAWIDFLHSAERCWNKLHARLKSHRRYHSWIGRYESLRKRDELLSYVTNARGAHEHTLAETTMIPYAESSIHQLTVKVGDEEARLMDLPGMRNSYEDTLRAVGLDINDDTKVSETPEHKAQLPASAARLPTVTNRGRRYGAPTRHLGGSVDPTDILAVATMALDWHLAAVTAAEQHFD